MVRTLLRGFRCATLWCDLDLTFDQVVVTMSFKIWSGLLNSVRLEGYISDAILYLG